MPRGAELLIGNGFWLPLDFATEAWAILARRGAGKSNAGVVIAEELHRNNLPFVAIDPKGDWWGIRSSDDGKHPGMAIPVFGGRHGDVPLEPGSGALIADLVLGDQNGYLSCVLDVSQMLLSEQRRFLTDFGERLFRQKDEQGVLTLLFEEAHEYLPQVVPAESRKLVSVYQRIVKQGRQRGLGVGMLTQRSAALNKDVLTQVGALILMRMMSPQDRNAARGWLDGSSTESGGILAELPSLTPGDAFIIAPEIWPNPERVQFRRRSTFDSGATPKAGQKRVMPRTLADVDLAAVKEAMADTIEKAKESDPKELRKRIRALEKQLAERPTVEPERVEVPVLSSDTIEALYAALEPVAALDDVLQQIQRKLSDHEIAQRHAQTSIRKIAKRITVPREMVGPTDDEPRPPRVTPPADGKLSKTERKILSALVQHGAMGHDKLALLSGYSAKASTISAALSPLRRKGLVEQGQPLQATAAGREIVQDELEPLPQGPDLIDYWRNRFGAPERKVLDALIAIHPERATHAVMAEMTGYSPTASTISALMSKLRKTGIVDGWNLSNAFQGATGL